MEYFAEDLIEQGIPEEALVPAFCSPPTKEAIAMGLDFTVGEGGFTGLICSCPRYGYNPPLRIN